VTPKLLPTSCHAKGCGLLRFPVGSTSNDGCHAMISASRDQVSFGALAHGALYAAQQDRAPSKPLRSHTP